MISSKSFGSDNHAGVHEAVLQALSAANGEDALPYGSDPWTERVSERLGELFGAAGGVFFVFTGTAANVLGLSLLLRPHEGVICPESAHLTVDECGAPERILGNKLLTVPAADGKLTPALIGARLGDRGDEHRVQPAVVAIAQATEYGTCYTLNELRDLTAFCRANGLRVYADGARLANAAAYLGCSLADLAAGIDILSFGGTKNGAMGAEAVVVRSKHLAVYAPFLRKQQMQLGSKMRYLAAQFSALLDGDLWLHNAQHANAMATRLAGLIQDIPGVNVCQPVESNAVFATLAAGHIERLARDWHFQVWDPPSGVVRWMTAFDTAEADVETFAGSVRAAALS